MHRGKRFWVSCKALGVPETKEASVQAANAWWRAKQAELDAAAVPPRRPPQPFDDVVGAMYDPSVLTSGEALYRLLFESILAHSQAGEFHLPEEVMKALRMILDHPRLKTEPLNEELAAAVRRTTVEDFLHRSVIEGEPLPENVQQNLPPARVNQLQDAAKALRGEATAPPERTVGAQFDIWLALKVAQAEAGNITANRAGNIRTALAHFRDFLGVDADVNTIDAARLQAFYLRVLAEVEARRKDTKAGWSSDYAGRVFLTAKAFIRHLWESDLIELPKNLTSKKFSFGNGPKTITTWTREEVRHVIGEAHGQLKLHLLLMANCGMTQKDVSDLRDEEVNWTLGTITRKRSKTKGEANVPTVCYKLWPQTFELLRQFRSGQDRVLLTTSGKPWVRARLNKGRLAAADAIHAAFIKLRQRLKFLGRLKELRKTGATLLESHKDYCRCTTIFLDHSPRSMKDKHYAAPPQDLIDSAIAWLGRELGLA
jgi:integrase